MQGGIPGIDSAFLNADVQVLAEQRLHFIAHHPGRKSRPEIGGPDGIGFGHDRLATILVALQCRKE